LGYINKDKMIRMSLLPQANIYESCIKGK